MEATPPDEPVKPKQPVPRRARAEKSSESQAAQWAAAASEQPAISPALADEFDNGQEATRVFGAFAIGLMVLLLFCVIAVLVAYRNMPAGL